ncbi:MAG: PAS domain S-box protein, partial [Bacteroidota bacterium]|nr:PAS domain S-box protein [Bacteroidota bacterium]
MKNFEDKSKEQLFEEIEHLNKRISELEKKEEKSLNNNEERYRLLFDSLPYGGTILNPKGEIINTSKSAATMLGYKISELIGKHITELLTPEFINVFRQNFPQVLSGKPFTAEIKMLCKNGKVLDIMRFAQPLIDANSKVQEILVIDIDIAERKQAEEALIKSEKRFKHLVKNSSDLIVIVDENGKETYVSDSVKRITGFSPDEVLNHSGFEFMHPDDVEHISEKLSELIKIPGRTLKVEYRHKTTDGGWVNLETLGTNCLNEPSINGIVLNIRDITERKNAEAALKKSELKFRELFEKSGDAMLLIENGKFVECNLSTVNMFGYENKEEILNLHPSEISPVTQPDDKNSLKKANEMMFTALRNGTNRFDWIHKKGNNDIFPAEVLLTGISNEKGNKMIHAVVRDITNRKKSEQEIISAKERAEESDRLKSAFLANMSHEIRTPMNGIIGFADLLKEPKLTGEEQKHYVEIIQNSGKRMLNIINNLIDISKVEAGQMKVYISDVNINTQTEYLYTFFKPEVDKKGLQLYSLNTLSQQEAVINTDREKVYAILTNLIKNAIKYTHKGKIHFGYIKKEKYIEFFVKDTGIGIPKDRQKAIFDRFVQSDIEDRHVYEGAGLGLAITRAYVEMLGGKIRVKS